ncbi:Gfo/Idh/MocA family oxidoreductase [Haloechinothrix sp. YIM 98757]|uniref:Gfo/Idh/MocA family oxidoreductase n=1 Tax=Haloechinothrix aidingensis TaxID=2752311 RepID=A0A838AD74_9PSEU|nr:Gfo/Idh/MocA family oxidoreductase [Haloechinothrix aidingensis]MBA0127246.1 Gfo/Idh/MocA family oxidoreductase [Haloechinothrix aidingensis]
MTLAGDHTDEVPVENRDHAWTVLHTPLTAAQLGDAVAAIAEQHDLRITQEGNGSAHVNHWSGATVVAVYWRSLPPQPPNTLGYHVPAVPVMEVLIQSCGEHAVATALAQSLRTTALTYHERELDGVAASMPLLTQYTQPDDVFGDWAVIFRDHFLEHSVGFLMALERSGLPAEWIYALDKGDRTHNRDRVWATFRARGYRTDLLDNAAINTPGEYSNELARTTAGIDDFIDAACAEGRRVLAVDDGGLLARGYGSSNAVRHVDAALELTVSGLKRIHAAGPMTIPVFNLARSQVKTLLGYPEIADSCVRRLRALIPDTKFMGRTIVLIGYGTLGSRVAHALRSLGCRVEVVDADLPTLITAAEAGYVTHRTVVQALRSTRPFLVIGATGETALSHSEIDALPDGVYLAPLATRDFALLGESPYVESRTDIPGVGQRLHLPRGQSATLLGNGRSMNLFEADSIPNQGYDAYRAATLIAAKALCRNLHTIPAGVHLERVDHAVAEAGLLEAYYQHYITNCTDSESIRSPARVHERPRSCVIGYGVAGRLHARILADIGAETIVIDPKHQDLPATARSFSADVADLPASVADTIDLWTVCCPTHDHLRVVRSILGHDPAARILLEKPACQADEIHEFTELLAQHPQARLVVNDQYRHTRTVPGLTELLEYYEPDVTPHHVAISFSKDRTPDIAHGRFVDRSYGVLGYEWLHMLSILDQLLPQETYKRYLQAEPATAELWAHFDTRMFLTALTERMFVHADTHETHVELASSLLGPRILAQPIPAARAPWRKNLRSPDDRHRHISMRAGCTHLVLHLDPVTTGDEHQLDRNHHRLTVQRGTELVHDEIIHDSPLDTAVRHSVAALRGAQPPPPPDFAALRRIARLADYLRNRTTPAPSTESDPDQDAPDDPQPQQGKPCGDIPVQL